jgi:hypothetical protein
VLIMCVTFVDVLCHLFVDLVVILGVVSEFVINENPKPTTDSIKVSNENLLWGETVVESYCSNSPKEESFRRTYFHRIWINIC